MVAVGVAYCSLRGYAHRHVHHQPGRVRVQDGRRAWPTCTRGACSRWTSSTWPASPRRSARWSCFVVFIAVLARHPQPARGRASPWPWPPPLTFVVLTFPLALFETPKSRRVNACAASRALFKQCFPLFRGAVHVQRSSTTCRSSSMEGVLTYDNQLYFNALYFPAQVHPADYRASCTSRCSCAWPRRGPTPRSGGGSTSSSSSSCWPSWWR